jgi:hypothetical protein
MAKWRTTAMFLAPWPRRRRDWSSRTVLDGPMTSDRRGGAARIEPGEVDENTAALSLARSVAGANLPIAETVTGRCNLISVGAGVLVLDAAVIDRVNMIDETITLATLAPFRRVAEGDLTATVKIIPFAVSAAALDRARVTAAEGPLRIAPFRPLRVGVVSTLLPGSKISSWRRRYALSMRGSCPRVARSRSMNARRTRRIRSHPHSGGSKGPAILL